MIAFIGGRRGQGWRIYTMADDGTNIRRLTDTFPYGVMLFAPFWSPDGESLAFTFREHSHSPYAQVCTIAIDSKKVRYLTPPKRFNFALQWLPNDLIVYQEVVYPETAERHAKAERFLCSMHRDGGQQRRILDHVDYDTITFSPDGAEIAMVSSRDHQLSLTRADGSAPVVIENDGLEIKRVIWAPDSRMLAFSAVRAGSRARVYEELYIVRDNGANKQRVGRVLAESPFALSPDNLQTATLGYHQGIFTINLINTQTLKSRKIATVERDPESGDPPGCPVWSPDGQYVLYNTFADPYVHIYRANVAAGETELIVGDEGAFRYVQELCNR
jgi:Tol biopolymer transport system component